MILDACRCSWGMRRRWLKPWTPDRIAAEAVRLNGLVDGGWVTITAHPIFGHGRWVIRLEDPLSDDEPAVIGTDPSLDVALEQARGWIEAPEHHCRRRTA